MKKKDEKGMKVSSTILISDTLDLDGKMYSKECVENMKKQIYGLKGKNKHLIILDDPLQEQDLKNKLMIANIKPVEDIIVWDNKDNIKSKKDWFENMGTSNKIDYTASVGYEVKEYELKSRRVWYKPWTWLLKPIKVIKDFTLKNVSLIKGDK